MTKKMYKVNSVYESVIFPQQVLIAKVYNIFSKNNNHDHDHDGNHFHENVICHDLHHRD